MNGLFYSQRSILMNVLWTIVGIAVLAGLFFMAGVFFLIMLFVVPVIALGTWLYFLIFFRVPKDSARFGWFEVRPGSGKYNVVRLSPYERAAFEETIIEIDDSEDEEGENKNV